MISDEQKEYVAIYFRLRETRFTERGNPYHTGAVLQCPKDQEFIEYIVEKFKDDPLFDVMPQTNEEWNEVHLPLDSRPPDSTMIREGTPILATSNIPIVTI